MKPGVNNPNVIPCPYCGGSGHVRNPFGNAICSDCGGRGWFTPDQYKRLQEKEQKNTARRKYANRKTIVFLYTRPKEAISTFLKIRKYSLEWKHYISVLWWVSLLISPLIVGAQRFFLLMGPFFIVPYFYYRYISIS